MRARYHPKFSGSNAHRFTRCSAQVDFTANIPDVETEDSRAGTFAHAVLEYAIDTGFADVEHLVGALKIENTHVDEETASAVQYAIDYVLALKAEHPDLEICAELLVQSQQDPEVGGTIDILCISAKARRIWIIDFKYGAGELVEVIANEQLMTYFICTTVFWLNADYTFTGVIIQPRHWAFNGAKEHNFLLADLYDFLVDLNNAVDAARGDEKTFTPGPWCHRCKGEATCAAREAACNDITRDFLGHPDDAGEHMVPLDPVRLAEIDDRAEEVRSWLRAVHSAAERAALTGIHIPGRKIVRERAARRYRADMARAWLEEEIRKISGNRLTLDQISPRKLLPLTEIESRLVKVFREAVPPEQRDAAAGQARAKFAFLTPRAEGVALKMVPESDPRPAYQPNPTADFAGVDTRDFI